MVSILHFSIQTILISAKNLRYALIFNVLELKIKKLKNLDGNKGIKE
jgi:hypothetical protein